VIRIEPRESYSRFMIFGVPLLSALVALLLAAIPLTFAGANIASAYAEMFNGVFGSRFAFTEMPFGRGFGILVQKASSISELWPLWP